MRRPDLLLLRRDGLSCTSHDASSHAHDNALGRTHQIDGQIQAHLVGSHRCGRRHRHWPPASESLQNSHGIGHARKADRLITGTSMGQPWRDRPLACGQATPRTASWCRPLSSASCTPTRRVSNRVREPHSSPAAISRPLGSWEVTRAGFCRLWVAVQAPERTSHCRIVRSC